MRAVFVVIFEKGEGKIKFRSEKPTGEEDVDCGMEELFYFTHSDLERLMDSGLIRVRQVTRQTLSNRQNERL